jgi:hypothetical protein
MFCRLLSQALLQSSRLIAFTSASYELGADQIHARYGNARRPEVVPGLPILACHWQSQSPVPLLDPQFVLNVIQATLILFAPRPETCQDHGGMNCFATTP